MGKVRCMLEGTIVAWKGTILILRRAFVEVRWKESVEPGGENQQLITRCGRGKSTSQNNVLLQFNPDSERSPQP